MIEEVLINVNRFETRVALLLAGVVQEVHLQRASGYSVTGNIYKGRVVRILPGMQAAFVEVGLARPGFLHARDVHFAQHTAELSLEKNGERDIRTLLHEGQEILVQAVKDPISTKGARLSTEIALASRYLVLMPFSTNLGVSQRIEDETERDRLRGLLTSLRVPGAANGDHVAATGAESSIQNDDIANAGWIVRTAAEAAASSELEADIGFLRRMWQMIVENQRPAVAPALIYEELPMHIRITRDLVGAAVGKIRVDERGTYEKVRAFAAQFLPEFVPRIEFYDEPVGLFDRFGVEDEISRALEAKVPLKSGGHLVIEQTEAMTTIDVNTGGFVGTHSLEETVYRTNLEAAALIPRQLRLRNLGGIIVIDFIDMEDPEHRRDVLRTLEKACEHDPARTRLSGLSSLGLVEMSRKRTRESLAQQLCAPCAACNGRGRLKAPESMCYEIFRAILRDAHKRSREQRALGPVLAPVLAAGREAEHGNYMVRASQLVIDRLLDEAADNVAALAEEVGTSIRFQVEPSYTNEQFDIVLMRDLER